VLLAQRLLPSSAALQQAVTGLALDSDAQLRFQVALSLGEWDDDRIIGPLIQIATAGTDDRWTRAAVASAVPRRAGRLIDSLLTGQPKPTAAVLVLLHDLAAVVGSRQDAAEIAGVLSSLKRLSGPDAVP